jgi:hypothetical protein
MAKYRVKVLKDRALAKEYSDVFKRVLEAPKEYKYVETAPEGKRKKAPKSKAQKPSGKNVSGSTKAVQAVQKRQTQKDFAPKK